MEAIPLRFLLKKKDIFSVEQSTSLFNQLTFPHK
jgi:hypothetical protein